jgi:hypothetical protein
MRSRDRCLGSGGTSRYADRSLGVGEFPRADQDGGSKKHYDERKCVERPDGTPRSGPSTGRRDAGTPRTCRSAGGLRRRGPSEPGWGCAHPEHRRRGCRGDETRLAGGRQSGQMGVATAPSLAGRRIHPGRCRARISADTVPGSTTIGRRIRPGRAGCGRSQSVPVRRSNARRPARSGLRRGFAPRCLRCQRRGQNKAMNNAATPA